MNFVAGIEQIAAQLKDVGATVDDTQIIAKILVSLPPSLQYFLPAWDSTPQDLKTLSSLTKRLVKEEMNQARNKEKKLVTGESALLGNPQQSNPDKQQILFDGQGHGQFAYPAGGYPGLRGGFHNQSGQRGRGRGFYRGRGGHYQRGGYHPYQTENREQTQQAPNTSRGGHQQSTIICFHCGEAGHIKRKCRVWKREMESQRNWNQDNGQQQSYSYKSSTPFDDRRYIFF